jgi:hypothetical protein
MIRVVIGGCKIDANLPHVAPPNERGLGHFTSGYPPVLTATSATRGKKTYAVLAGDDGPRRSGVNTMRHVRLDCPRLDNEHRLSPCSLPGLRLSHQFGRNIGAGGVRSGIGGRLESGMPLG